MSFESIEAAEQFYKNYAHDNGFSVHVGQQRLENGIVYWKRFLCSRQGFRKNKCNDNIQHSGGKKTHNLFETRCGCDAYIYVKLSSGNRYTIEAMIEEHNHGLVSPDKCHLLRSNRSVSEWIRNRYHIRESWIPAYYMDVPLAGILRTTSRSESANSFF